MLAVARPGGCDGFTSSGQTTLSVLTDAQTLPVWLSIDGVALNAYGGQFCCTNGEHDDPFFMTSALLPGQSVEFTWGGATIVQAQDPTGGCSLPTFVPPGTYLAHACAYEGQPPQFPSADAGAELCTDFTIVLDASGMTTLNAELH